MNNKFDELTKSVAQSVTRRGALTKFGVGLAGMALACFGLANNANAARGKGCFNKCMHNCLRQGGYPDICRASCGLQCYGF